jgi:DNA mismatch endonuclease (patch repair protein)
VTDDLTPEQRRLCMAAVKGKNTSPELLIRSLLHRLGYRYTLHSSILPGKPDLVFPSRQKIIFVHGCFWHMHSCRKGKNAPTSNAEFWELKRTKNTVRDRNLLRVLRRDGWKVFIVWECWLRKPDRLTSKLQQFLDS